MGLNIVYGGNGSGKTSILEAAYLLGRGASFRHHRSGPMIRDGADSVLVNADLVDSDTGVCSHLGLSIGRSVFECRLNGDAVRKRSALAMAFPVQWISSQPQHLLDQGPEVRRRFLDFGLFHVEHDYLAHYLAFHRILKQRNASLRRGDRRSVVAWDPGFVETANALHEIRSAFCGRLAENTHKVLRAWDFTIQPEIRYQRGWSQEKDLEELLRDRLDQDIGMGFTTVGPTRADISIRANGQPVDKVLSRGQQKMVVAAMNLALSDIHEARFGRAPTMLVDDLPAELDHDNQALLIESIRSRDIQALIASIELPRWVNQNADKVFHVEHGRLQ